MLRNTFVALITSSLVFACGGSSATQETTTPVDTDTKPDFEIKEQKVEGMRFTPEAMAVPDVQVSVSKTSIARQKKVYGKASGAKKAKLGITLVGSLWNAGWQENEAQIMEVLGEIGKIGEGSEAGVLLHAQALEIKGDMDGALSAYADLLARFPESEQANRYRVRQAWLHMMKGEHDKVATVLGEQAEWPVEKLSDEGAYVIAWHHFMKGEPEKALPFMHHAAKNWKQEASRPAVRRDMLLLLSRSGAEAGEAIEMLKSVAEDEGANSLGRLTGQLAQAYYLVGQYQQAGQVIDILIEKATTPAALMELNFFQVRIQNKMIRPVKVANFLSKAWEQILVQGDEANAQVKATVAQSVLGLAYTFDGTYRTTFDARFYDAAKKLYELYATFEGRPEEESKKASAEFQNMEGFNAKKAEDKAIGELSQEILDPIVPNRIEEAVACYERYLLGQEGLTGNFAITFTISESGEVTESTAEPAEGDIGPVATCLAEKAKNWNFPTRSKPGTTRVRATYSAAPKAE